MSERGVPLDRASGRPSSLPSLPRELYLPDDVLVGKLVEYGMPRHEADAVRTQPTLRTMAQLFYFDTIEAAKGDRAAKERVNVNREGWARLNRQGKAGPPVLG